MSPSNQAARAAAIKQQLATLPNGTIAMKTIRGHTYPYHRWYENGHRKEKFLSDEAAREMREQLTQRKALEAELASLEGTMRHNHLTATSQDDSQASPKGAAHSTDAELSRLRTNARLGNSLRMFSEPVRPFKRRECYQKLAIFLSNEPHDKVLVLCGLRRTGKTTLIRQAILDMNDSELSRAAFIQVTPRDTLADLNFDLRLLEAHGFRYVFIDEVTLIDDFVEGAALFSDVFATCGMRIVLSGTDSLGFVFAEDEQLYDRCITIHTTLIPYREFEGVLGIVGIDEYIRYGGTMSLSGTLYNENATFATKRSTDEYVNSAIARNIQHSLRCYQGGRHFRSLQSLYEKGELTNVINRIVEDMNHRFTLEVLSRDFTSSDLAISARNLRRDRTCPNDVLDRVNIGEVTARLRQLLEIRNEEERSLPLSEAHVAEIEEYLALLDLTQRIDVVSIPGATSTGSRTVITQPGLRYAQAEALVESLLLDEQMDSLSIEERNYVLDRIRSEIAGRMMEDIVLTETSLAFPRKRVFVLQFAIGEFDMVIFDAETNTCEIFEIKHSDKEAPAQYRHLVNKEKCAATQHRFGKITGKYVLYRGETHMVGEIQYQNVEEYLRSLPEA